MEDTEKKPKKRGNPNFKTGQPNPYPTAGKNKNDGITIREIISSVHAIVGTDLQTLLAHHLLITKEAYEDGTDKKSYTTLLNSLLDRCVIPLSREVNLNVSGKIDHIALLHKQDEAITERLRGYLVVPSIETTVKEK